ncbi:hypothetical protein DB346_09300 [Verrucomicrobia bacterium LW23]|nr:hypothetical protein DB346_09300 [Verrucomicrobia bacterium LW23]
MTTISPSPSALSPAATSEAPSSGTPATARLRLVTRGDDAASSLSANRAIREACERGVLRNVSVMAPCAWLHDAFEQLGHLSPHVAFGLHVTLTAEWDFPRWGPVLGAARVPALVDTDGCFYRQCAAIAENARSRRLATVAGNNTAEAGAVDADLLAQAMEEVASQLATMRAVGFRPVYMDEHMGVGRAVNGLSEALHAFAAAEGLIFRPELRPLRVGHREDANYGAAMLEALRCEAESGAAAPDGTLLPPLLVVAHPAYDDAEMREIRNASNPPGRVARDREGQRLLFTQDAVRDYVAANVTTLRYDEAGAPRRHEA